MLFRKREIIKIILIILILIIFFSSVDILGLIFTPPGKFYTRANVDIDVYFTYMDQARVGRFWFCNQYAVEDHQCKLFFPLWYLAGRIGVIFGISNLISLIIIRIIILIILFYIFFKFCEKLFPQNKYLVFLLGIFSGGLVNLYNNNNIFIALLENPLSGLIYLLVILILWQMINSFASINFFKASSLFFLCWLLVMIHPYDALALIIITGILVLFCSFTAFSNFIKGLKIFFIINGGVFIGSIYYLRLFFSESFYGSWLVHNYLPLEPNYVFLLAGILIPVSLIGCFLIIKQGLFKKHHWLVIFSFLVGSYLLLFLPLFFTRKLLIYWYLGLFLTAIVFLIHLKQKQKILTIILIAILMSGNFGYYFSELKAIFTGSSYHYFPQEYQKPMAWLKENDNLDQRIINSPNWSTYLAAASGLRSFIGSNQIDQPEYKESLVKWFYQDNNQDSEKKQFLKEYKINYVYYSPVEQTGGTFNPDSKDYLKKIYDDGWARIYQVIDKVN